MFGNVFVYRIRKWQWNKIVHDFIFYFNFINLKCEITITFDNFFFFTSVSQFSFFKLNKPLTFKISFVTLIKMKNRNFSWTILYVIVCILFIKSFLKTMMINSQLKKTLKKTGITFKHTQHRSWACGEYFLSSASLL